jgi:hypothetical protein
MIATFSDVADHDRHRERAHFGPRLGDHPGHHVRVEDTGGIRLHQHPRNVTLAGRHILELRHAAADDRQARDAGDLDLERIRRQPRQQREFDLERLPHLRLGEHVVFEVHRRGGFAGRHGIGQSLVFGRLDWRRTRGATLGRGGGRHRSHRLLLLAPPAGSEHGGERDDREDAGTGTGGENLLHGGCSQPVMLTVMQVRPRRGRLSSKSTWLHS